MNALSLTILLLGTFAAGICLGFSAASFAYARRYRQLRVEIVQAAQIGLEIFRL